MIMLSGCDCSKPTEPDSIITQYPIYFYNRVGEQLLFKYQPDTQTMDSTIIQWDPDVITLSADGKLLYLVLQSSIVIIDAETYEFVRELPYTTLDAIGVSPDNKLVAIMGDTLRILQTSDYQIIFADTSGYTYRGNFSNDNSTFYCGIADSNHETSVYKIELSSPNFGKTIKPFPIIGVRSIKPTHDQSRWIIYGGISFNIYDVALDSIIFQDYLVGGWGSTALSADGGKVFYTDPGRPQDMIEILPVIKIFNIETNAIESIIDSNLFYSDGSIWALPNTLVITPDDKFLGVLNGNMSATLIHFIDLETLTLRDKKDYSSNQYFVTPLTVQSMR